MAKACAYVPTSAGAEPAGQQDREPEQACLVDEAADDVEAAAGREALDLAVGHGA